jgi:hypothetical protein
MSLASKIKPLIGNLSVLVITLVIAAFAAELVLRMLVNPMDFLSPELIQDEVVGYRIMPNSGHHDAWGFRNKRVPKKADIVTIGDSQTYGDGARASDSWPGQLQRLTGKEVYNLSLGGYGPAQYLYLLESRALQLNPETVIVGLYPGNDFMNAFEMVYGYDFWKDWRSPGFEAADYLHKRAGQIISFNRHPALGSVGWWFQNHSVLYNLASLSFVQLRKGHREDARLNTKFSFVETNEAHYQIGFKAAHRLTESNYEDPNIKEGQRIAFRIISRMNDICMQRGINFVVLLIPIKEHIYSKYIDNSSSDLLRQVVNNEIRLREMVVTFLEENNIRFIDPLEDLQYAADLVRVYSYSPNDHPNINGYRIIAEEVARNLLPEKNP